MPDKHYYETRMKKEYVLSIRHNMNELLIYSTSKEKEIVFAGNEEQALRLSNYLAHAVGSDEYCIWYPCEVIRLNDAIVITVDNGMGLDTKVQIEIQEQSIRKIVTEWIE